MKHLILIALFLISLSAKGQRFKFLETTNDTTYGYTPQNPLLLKKGEPITSIQNTRKYFAGLRTYRNESFHIEGRTSLLNPKMNDEEFKAAVINNIRNGAPAGANLDRYTLISEYGTDTIVLYVDIYEKGEVKVPHGLKWKD